MKVTLRSAWLLLCLPAMPLFLCGQAPETPATPTTPSAPATEAPSAATPAPPPSPAALPPPRYTLNTTNTGMGLSIEPIYWLTRGHLALHTGDDNNTGVPGNLGDFPGSLNHAYGATVIVPAGKNASVRFNYFQTTLNGGTIASENLNLFGTAITGGDPLATQAKVTNYKLSYDYVTYFWNHRAGDVRLKTLYEVQYVSVDSTIDDFQPQTDGSFVLNPVAGTKSIILPTFGVGLDGTVSPHFRWEIRGSGFGLPHRAEIGDAEANVGVRFGHVELVVGGRAYYFRTTRRADHYNSGTPYGPYAGLRFYWKKK